MSTTVVLRGLGCLLLTAAALKAHGLAVEPVSAMGWFSSSWFQFGLIEAETLLGIWLLAASHPRAGWLTAFLLFSLFALVSLYQAWIGQASCGCFGRLAVNPWYAFTIDVLALATLARGRPRPLFLLAVSEPSLQVRAKPTLAWAFTFVWVLALFTAIAHLAFGSVDAAVAYLRGERLSIRPRLIDLGAGTIGESREATIELTNRNEGPVRVVGGTSDCSCVTTRDLPLVLQAGETRTITLVVRYTGRPGIFARTAELFADAGQFKKVLLHLTGRAVAPANRSERE